MTFPERFFIYKNRIEQNRLIAQMRNLKLLILLLVAAAYAEAPAAQVAPTGKPPVKITDIWIVFKTHYDLGFTGLAADVFKKYRENDMDQVLALFEATKNDPPGERFVWTMPGWPLANVLGPLQDAGRRSKIEAAVRQGLLVPHALPFTTHTESLDIEDLVRGMDFSSAIARKYGRPLPLSAKMTDVAVHSWILPTLLANAGVRFLQIGANAGVQYARLPPLFYWEGPDGSRILCQYSRNYGTNITPPMDWVWRDPYPWPCKNYLAMIMRPDNSGPPDLAEFRKVLAAAASGSPDARIHVGTLDDFRKAIEAEKPELPVVRADMPDTWIHGTMSMPIETKTARDIRPLEPALDVLDTELRAYGLKTTNLAPLLAQAYEDSLLYGEHTWGLHSGPRGVAIFPLEKWKATVPPNTQAVFLKSFDDHRNYIRKTHSIVSGELDARMTLLADAVHAEGEHVVVYNPLPWPRTGIVSLPTGGRLLAVNVPANGYRTYLIKNLADPAPAVSNSSTSLDTSYYKVTFDLDRGGIASLVGKKSGRELVDKSSGYALGQFLHERFSVNEVNRFSAYASDRVRSFWPDGAVADIAKPGMPGPAESPYLAVTPAGWTITQVRSDLEDVVTLTAGDAKGLARGYTLVFKFPHQAAYVDEEWTVTDKVPNKIPEGGWLCFPFAVENPRFTVGRPGGPINPATDIVPGANREILAVSTGVAMAGPDGSGAELFPLDSPLVSLEKPGLWQWSLDFVPKKSVVFINLYNNQYNTNFPLWQDGTWSERARILAVGSGNQCRRQSRGTGLGGTCPIVGRQERKERRLAGIKTRTNSVAQGSASDGIWRAPTDVQGRCYGFGINREPEESCA